MLTIIAKVKTDARTRSEYSICPTLIMALSSLDSFEVRRSYCGVCYSSVYADP